MTSFPIEHVDFHLLERIMTKVEKKSYFRLQQTCKWVGDVVRTSKKISVAMDMQCFLTFRDSNWQISSLPSRLNWKIRPPTAEEMYGTRMDLVQPREKEGEFDSLVAFLKKYHITCEKLRLNGWYWNKEQCAVLIKILQPIEVDLKSWGYNRFQALFQAKHLESLEVVLYWNDDTSKCCQLMSMAEEVHIRFGAAKQYPDYSTKFEQEDFLHKTMSALNNPPPSLRQFKVEFHRPCLSKGEIEEVIKKANLLGNRDKSKGHFRKCKSSKNGASSSRRREPDFQLFLHYPRSVYSSRRTRDPPSPTLVPSSFYVSWTRNY